MRMAKRPSTRPPCAASTSRCWRVHGFFHGLHLVQTHTTYDGLHGDVSFQSSQASVIALLGVVFAMEAPGRGMFLGIPSHRGLSKAGALRRAQVPWLLLQLGRDLDLLVPPDGADVGLPPRLLAHRPPHAAGLAHVHRRAQESLLALRTRVVGHAARLDHRQADDAGLGDVLLRIHAALLRDAGARPPLHARHAHHHPPRAAGLLHRGARRLVGGHPGRRGATSR